MTEINVIVKELWQRTYQGKDIDTIEILSEDDDTVVKGKKGGSAAAPASAARKVYKWVE
jgi:hypothetical protein